MTVTEVPELGGTRVPELDTSSQGGHKIIAAGDLNILKGYGEYGNRYWAGAI